MEFEHEQIPFATIKGEHTTVDVGIFDIMTALRLLGVETQYSCEGQFGQAYFVATSKSVRPVLRRIRKLYRKNAYSECSRHIVENFLGARRYYEIRIDKQVSAKESRVRFRLAWNKKGKDDETRYSFERLYSSDFGFRHVFRWDQDDSECLLNFLYETI